MPKMKTRRGAAKRFRATAKGKLKRKRSKMRHILTSKSPKQKRRLVRAGYVSTADVARIKRLVPYY